MQRLAVARDTEAVERATDAARDRQDLAPTIAQAGREPRERAPGQDMQIGAARRRVRSLIRPGLGVGLR